jgi:hypothetical protein
MKLFTNNPVETVIILLIIVLVVIGIALGILPAPPIEPESGLQLMTLLPLLPCPFCGGKAWLKSRGGYSWVACEACGMETKKYNALNSADNVFSLWNARANAAGVLVIEDSSDPAAYALREGADAERGVWIRIKNIDVRVYQTDEGVVVDMYPTDSPETDAVASTWMAFAEAVDDDDDDGDGDDLYSHRHNPGFCAKCGGNCQYDDQGNKGGNHVLR